MAGQVESGRYPLMSVVQTDNTRPRLLIAYNLDVTFDVLFSLRCDFLWHSIKYKGHAEPSCYYASSAHWNLLVHGYSDLCVETGLMLQALFPGRCPWSLGH